jgi:hypothetical protein
MSRFVRFLQGVALDPPHHLARRAQATAPGVFSSSPEERARFLAAHRASARPGTAVLGSVADDWVGLPSRELVSMHGVCSGATGAGKTMWLLSCLMQILRDEVPTIVIDPKAETVARLTQEFLPAMMRRGLLPERALEQMRIIRPFARGVVTPLNITLPEPGIDIEVQAMSVLQAIEQGLGERFGGRMQRMALSAIKLAIETSQPLTAVRTWLANPAAFARQALTSRDPELRTYVRTSLEREHDASVQATLARLDSFVFLPQTRAALEAPSCVSFAAALESGLTLINLGDAPAGLEGLIRFWGAVLFGKIQRAILSREVTPETTPCWLVIDEAPVIMGPEQAAGFERLLSLARYRKVGLLLVTQFGGQLSAVDRVLTESLATNVRYEVRFRTGYDEARRVSGALLSENSRFGRDDVARALTTLPDRHFLFRLRQGGFAPQLLRSPRLDMDDFCRAAAGLSTALRQHMTTGSVAIPAREATRVAHQVEAQIFALPSRDATTQPNSRFPRLG